MSNNGGDPGHRPPGRVPDGEGPAGRRPIDAAVAAKRRAQLVAGLRGLAQANGSGVNGESSDPSGGPSVRNREAAARNGAAGAPNGASVASSGASIAPNGASALQLGAASADPAVARAPTEERCDLCETTIPEDHRHLLNLVERRIECVCEACWALRSGDAEFRPTGGRTLWLEELVLPDDVWASFQIPIGLAFFMESTIAGCVVALYPSPGGATESELHFSSWSRMVELNPILADLEPDIEGLIVNRLSEPAAYAIAPIDRCYALTGTIKVNWEGISGGPRVRDAVSAFFGALQAEALAL